MKYCMGDFGESNTEIKTQDDYYSMRVNQMQPAMVEFQTQDSIEREFLEEVENLVSSSDDVYFESEGGTDVEIDKVAEKPSDVNVQKVSLEQAAQKMSATQAQPNKPLFYTIVAGVAALIYFGQD